MGNEGEPKKTGGGEQVNPTDKIIGIVTDNFSLFVNGGKDYVRLVDLDFVPKQKEVIIGHVNGKSSPNIAYGNLNGQIEDVFKKYRRSGFQPISTKTFPKLKAFDDMPPELTAYIGRDILITSTTYILVSMDGQKAGVYRERYSLPDREALPIAEIWTAARVDDKPEPETNKPIKGNEARTPIPVVRLITSGQKRN